MKQGKFDEAISYAQKTLEVYAENTDAITILFNCYAQKKDLQSCVNYFSAATKKYAASDAYYFYLGYAYAMMGNKNNAYSCLNTATQLNPQWGEGANNILQQLK